jgi:acyl-CoA reductase-like NAD-dependent aldehyde dehydrogenase
MTARQRIGVILGIVPWNEPTVHAARAIAQRPQVRACRPS